MGARGNAKFHAKFQVDVLKKVNKSNKSNMKNRNSKEQGGGNIRSRSSGSRSNIGNRSRREISFY